MNLQGIETISKQLMADFYFVHPCAPWERCANENANGLMRQHCPTSRGFTAITQQDLNMAMERLDNCLRKRFEYWSL